MRLFAGRFQVDDFFAAKDAELLAPLGAEADEKGSHAVIIVLAPFFERMMVAFGASDANAEEELRGRLRPIGGGGGRQQVICVASGRRAAPPGHEGSPGLMRRLVLLA